MLDRTVHGVACLLGQGQDDDARQQAWLMLLRKLPDLRIDPSRSVFGWVTQVAKNEVLGWRKRDKRVRQNNDYIGGDIIGSLVPEEHRLTGRQRYYEPRPQVFGSAIKRCSKVRLVSKPTSRMTLHLDPNELTAIDREAVSRGITRSRLIQRLLSEYTWSPEAVSTTTTYKITLSLSPTELTALDLGAQGSKCSRSAFVRHLLSEQVTLSTIRCCEIEKRSHSVSVYLGLAELIVLQNKATTSGCSRQEVLRRLLSQYRRVESSVTTTPSVNCKVHLGQRRLAAIDREARVQRCSRSGFVRRVVVRWLDSRERMSVACA